MFPLYQWMNNRETYHWKHNQTDPHPVHIQGMVMIPIFIGKPAVADHFRRYLLVCKRWILYVSDWPTEIVPGDQRRCFSFIGLTG